MYSGDQMIAYVRVGSSHSKINTLMLDITPGLYSDIEDNAFKEGCGVDVVLGATEHTYSWTSDTVDRINEVDMDLGDGIVLVGTSKMNMELTVSFENNSMRFNGYADNAEGHNLILSGAIDLDVFFNTYKQQLENGIDQMAIESEEL